MKWIKFSQFLFLTRYIYKIPNAETCNDQEQLQSIQGVCVNAKQSHKVHVSPTEVYLFSFQHQFALNFSQIHNKQEPFAFKAETALVSTYCNVLHARQGYHLRLLQRNAA